MKRFFIVLLCPLMIGACTHLHGNADEEPSVEKETTETYPSRPVVQWSETAEDEVIHLTLHVVSQGATSYHVSYEGTTYKDSNSFVVQKDILDTTLSVVTKGQIYNMTIYSSNAIGNSSVYMFNFGASYIPLYSISTHLIRKTLRYYVQVGRGASDYEIDSVYITQAKTGDIVLTPDVGPGTAIDISFLSRGYYIITVVIDNQSYRRLFTIIQ